MRFTLHLRLKGNAWYTAEEALGVGSLFCPLKPIRCYRQAGTSREDGVGDGLMQTPLDRESGSEEGHSGAWQPWTKLSPASCVISQRSKT